MEISDLDIQNSCGEQPLGETYTDPGNNPDFVFVKDPNFEVVTLFDIDGNIVNVNSWSECVHYLQGGWVSNQINNFAGSKYIAVSLTIVSIIVTGFVLYKNKKYNEIN